MALIVKNSAKEDRDMNIGFMEAFTGIGFLTGPLFGAFMFNLGGYVMPFAASAALILFMYPFVGYSLIKVRNKRKLEEESQFSKDGT